MSDDDDLPTIPCPYCRREIIEDAERCPYCENYISREDVSTGPRSSFWVVMVVLALLASVFWVMGR